MRAGAEGVSSGGKLHGGLARNSRYRNNPINPAARIDNRGGSQLLYISPCTHLTRPANFPWTKKLIIRVLTAALGHESISTPAIRVNMGIERRAFKRPRVHLQMNKFIFAGEQFSRRWKRRYHRASFLRPAARGNLDSGSCLMSRVELNNTSAGNVCEIYAKRSTT